METATIPISAGAAAPRGHRAVRIVAVLAVLFTAGALVGTVFERSGLAGAGTLRSLYRSVCHQLPSRSLEVAGSPSAVCSRCLGLYAGGSLGLLVAAVAFRRRPLAPHPLLLAAVVAPSLIDVLAHWVGWQGLTSVARLAMALPAGFVAGLFLAVGVADLGEIRWTSRLPICSDRP